MDRRTRKARCFSLPTFFIKVVSGNYLKMNKDIIPKELHFLIKMVEKWGLPDDGYRDEQLYNASKSELQDIIQSLSIDDYETLNQWLVNNAENENINMSNEYVNFTCYLMAYEMAEVLIKNT